MIFPGRNDAVIPRPGDPPSNPIPLSSSLGSITAVGLEHLPPKERPSGRALPPLSMQYPLEGKGPSSPSKETRRELKATGKMLAMPPFSQKRKEDSPDGSEGLTSEQIEFEQLPSPSQGKGSQPPLNISSPESLSSPLDRNNPSSKSSRMSFSPVVTRSQHPTFLLRESFEENLAGRVGMIEERLGNIEARLAGIEQLLRQVIEQKK